MNDRQRFNAVRLLHGYQSMAEEVRQRCPHKPKELTPQMKRRLCEEAVEILLKNTVLTNSTVDSDKGDPTQDNVAHDATA